jgi:hypothetical protein
MGEHCWDAGRGGARRALPGEGSGMSGVEELAEQLAVAVRELARLRGLVDEMLDGSGEGHYAAIRALRADRNARRTAA